LEQLSQTEGFWNDPQVAGTILKEIEAHKGELRRFDELSEAAAMWEELWPMAESEAEQHDLERQFAGLQKQVDEWELRTYLGGEYDNHSVLLSIHAGAGGTEAQDWAEMLLRMYLRFAEREGYTATLLDEGRGNEAGIKSAELEISGSYAYGYLRSEAGVHRLVRLSPFNADQLRQTSFAMVEVLPILEANEMSEIKTEDLRIDTYRASGAGGQHVNKTESAIRITHLPTNIVVQCQSERSQIQNRERAMRMLRAKLAEQKRLDDEAVQKGLKGATRKIEWGSQIRSYVLHPYTMVKDHRTKYETSNASRVLEGDIKDFMEHYLRFAAKEK
jgi:peptide chain release factor 2